VVDEGSSNLSRNNSQRTINGVPVDLAQYPYGTLGSLEDKLPLGFEALPTISQRLTFANGEAIFGIFYCQC
jgi:hypothetical protein